MRCPHCEYDDSKVIDSRSVESGIRRRRECLECGARFTTYERVDNSIMSIVKKDRRRESFDREKLLVGLRRACQKRPLPTGTVEKLADDIEYELQRMGRTEVPSSKVGEMVMEKLLSLDQIAYVRFASVYRSFADISSLKKVVDDLVSVPDGGSQLPLIAGETLETND